MDDNLKAESTAAVSTDEATAQLSLTQALEQTTPGGIDSSNNTDENIFVASQRGDVEAIRRLVESGKAAATDRDPQNITPLHWAAINAQVAACRYLLDQGADVDALGGDLVATPLQWAARNGYLYIIQLLISYGADPTITDSQGYNTLHLVTHSSSLMPLLYLLHQPISVDSRDSQGHTALMWAAYQGDALSVDLLLRHGASATTKDDAGLTPLHWAVVRGNRVSIRRIIDAGADLLAKDEEGRTPRDMAVELKALGAWKRALEEGGMDEHGIKKPKHLGERNTKIAIFVLPTLFFGAIFSTLAILPWYTGVVLALAEFFALHHIVSRVLLNSKTYTGGVNQSPYFAGIITASIIWVVYCWLTHLIKDTASHPFAHLVLGLAVMLCTYDFFRAITLDAGGCPKPSSDAELKSVIEDLASEGRLNGQTFCIQCMARKPLRSKHCRICERCIARHDHHCPWIWNCVGVTNHRQFLLFVIFLVLGIITFDYLTYAYLKSLPVLPADQVSPSCPLPSDMLCSITTQDAFLVAVGIWATLQLSWTIVLLASQLWQVARQMTTLEVSNLGRYGFMGGRGGTPMSSSSSQNGLRHSSSLVGEDSALMGSGGSGDGASLHVHSNSRSSSGWLMNLLGFDRFTKGRAVSGLKQAGKASNPFDMGMFSNCKDFWTAGRELGVNYDSLYDVPMEGFAEAKRRRRGLDGDDHASVSSTAVVNGGKPGSGGGRARSMLMGLLSAGGSRSRQGYEPVSQQV